MKGLGTRALTMVGVAALAALFAVFNGGERVTVRLGIATFRAVPLSVVVLISILVGMVAVFAAGFRADLRMRRMVRRYRQALGGDASEAGGPARATESTQGEAPDSA